MTKPGYKMTEIGEIPEEWNLNSISELVSDLIGGGTPSTSEPDFWNGDIPWTRGAALTNHYLEEGELHITKKGLENSATNLIPADNILLATRVDVGNVSINKVDMTISQDVTGLILNKTLILSEYFYWYMKKIASKILQKAQGSTIKGILKSYLSGIQIAVPSSNEQQIIAEILTTADRKIEVIDGEIYAAERLKKGLIQTLLSKGIGHTKFKMTEVGEIPEEWGISTVVNEYNVVTGTTPSTKAQDYWNDGKVEWLTPRDLRVLGPGLTIFSSERKITEKAVKETSLDILPSGSIIISTRAPVGYVGINETESTFNQGCKGLMPRSSDQVDTRFHAYFISNRSALLNDLSSGSTFKELSKDALERVLIPLPNYKEQQIIAEILTTADRKIELLNKKKEAVGWLKKGLMQVLLTGQVRVKAYSQDGEN